MKTDDISTIYTKIKDEDERRLAKLGYAQEVKRIFGVFTNFGLAASMISVMLGIIPLYTYSLRTGGPAVMLWTWIIGGIFTFFVVGSLAEICSAFPTMGALYYWSFRLGGDDWGRFSAWTSGWCNLIGQIAGVASGGYAGAEIIGDIISIQYDYELSAGHTQAIFLAVLCTQTVQPASFIVGKFVNKTGFHSIAYCGLIGVLAAASTFTGYDTAAHVAEETTHSHQSTPRAMMFSLANCLILGLLMIIGMNSCISDIDSLIDPNNTQQAYSILWQQVVGKDVTVFFLIIVLVGIECSNCANLTSASRMIYSFARDGALFRYFYNMNHDWECPLRSIWLVVIISFLMGLPGLVNDSALSALFSLTATGLYCSYLIPILLRITVSRDSFAPAEFNLGKWSVLIGYISVLWCSMMIVLLCLPTTGPVVTGVNMNYSPLVLGGTLSFSWIWWQVSAKYWFKGAAKCINDDNKIENNKEFDMINLNDNL
eukprot:gene7533-10266_t